MFHLHPESHVHISNVGAVLSVHTCGVPLIKAWSPRFFQVGLLRIGLDILERPENLATADWPDVPNITVTTIKKETSMRECVAS